MPAKCDRLSDRMPSLSFRNTGNGVHHEPEFDCACSTSVAAAHEHLRSASNESRLEPQTRNAASGERGFHRARPARPILSRSDTQLAGRRSFRAPRSLHSVTKPFSSQHPGAGDELRTHIGDLRDRCSSPLSYAGEMTGEGIEPPLFLFVRQAPYHLGDPAEMRETRFELAMPIWKTGVIPASPLSQEKSPRR